MILPPKHGNPLRYIVLATIITLPFDLYLYIVRGYLIAFGIVIVIGKALFLLLCFRSSRAAWHVGFVLTAAIIPLSLLLIYFDTETVKPQPLRQILVELAIVVVLLVYQWCIRKRYFDYIRMHRDRCAVVLTTHPSRRA